MLESILEHCRFCDVYYGSYDIEENDKPALDEEGKCVNCRRKEENGLL